MEDPFDFTKMLAKGRRKRRIRSWLLGLSVFIATVIGGLGTIYVLNRPTPVIFATRTAASQFSVQFTLCSFGRWDNFVIDGDTIDYEGRRIRVADIDAPEKTDPKSESERELAMKATYRLLELLNEGTFEVVPIGSRDQDQYGRDLRVLTRDGRSLGDILVSGGLARTWTGQREPWC